MSSLPSTFNRLLGLFLISWLVFSPLSSTYAEEKTPDAERQYTLTLDNADILNLIKWAAQLTNKTIVLHPSVRGKVTVLAGDPMTRQEAYELFQAILQVNGLALVEDEINITVVPGNEAKISGTQIAKPITGEGVAIYVIKIRNTTSNAVYTSILPLITKTGFVASDNNTNKILVADRRHNVEKIVGIIKELDKDEGLDIEIIPIQHANAQTLVTTLEKLIISGGRSQGPSKPTIGVDLRTNSILLSATQSVRDQVHKIIESLDQPLSGEGDVRVFKLEYISVADILTILQGIAERHNQPVSGAGNQTTPKSSGEQISIQSSENLNLLVISAPQTEMAKIQGIISEVDVPRPQVLVEAMIIEIGDDTNDALGIQWLVGNINEALDANSEIIGGGFRNFPAPTAPVSIDTTTGNVNLASGFSVGHYAGGNLRSILNTVLTDTKANILSTPTILALDNEEASILVGSNVPLISGNQQQGVSGNVLQTITRRDIGVSLSVTPQINNAGTITLTIQQTVENLTQSAISTADIITNKRELNTKVIVRDRQILVLGGLIRDEISEGKTRTPILGHLPLLGNLFSSTTVESTKRNLMVFIRPTILRSDDASQSATNERYNFLRSLRHGLKEDQSNLFRSPRDYTKLSDPDDPNSSSFIDYQTSKEGEEDDSRPETCAGSRRVGSIRKSFRKASCD